MTEVKEVIEFSYDDVLEELLDSPFQRKSRIGNKFGLISRYSDGEWPVFYSAVERNTAARESAYHYGRKAAGSSTAGRAVFYSVVVCKFVGQAIDLRPQLPIWQDLVSDDYTFCNALGKEANETGVDGFLAPSARELGGTTAPIFVRLAISSATIEATAKLTFESGDTVIEIEDIV